MPSLGDSDCGFVNCRCTRLLFYDQKPAVSFGGKGTDFLEDWINLNVTEYYRHGDRFSAKALAERCIVDAAAAGTTIDDLVPEWGSVETIIYEAMQYDKDAEVEYWNKFAETRYLYLPKI